MNLQELDGADLGTRVVRYSRADAALYALAVGARAHQLELVYERDQQTLPTYATALGMWATAVAATRGEYGPTEVLHVGQRMKLLNALPPAGELEMTARIAAVHDKQTAALLDIRVECAEVELSYLMYVRGRGGWGGDRGPQRNGRAPQMRTRATLDIDERAAVLYRLTGDFQPIHVDLELAQSAGLRRPLLHGLCTLGMTVRESAQVLGRSGLDVETLDVRLLAPVYPGDAIQIATSQDATETDIAVSASVAGVPVLAGQVGFKPEASNS